MSAINKIQPATTCQCLRDFLPLLLDLDLRLWYERLELGDLDLLYLAFRCLLRDLDRDCDVDLDQRDPVREEDLRDRVYDLDLRDDLLCDLDPDLRPIESVERESDRELDCERDRLLYLLSSECSLRDLSFEYLFASTDLDRDLRDFELDNFELFELERRLPPSSEILFGLISDFSLLFLLEVLCLDFTSLSLPLSELDDRLYEVLRTLWLDLEDEGSLFFRVFRTEFCGVVFTPSPIEFAL